MSLAFPLISLASDCFDQLYNFTSVLKVSHYLESQLYADEGVARNGATFNCDSSSYLAELEKEWQGKKKYFAFLKKKMAPNQRLDPEFLQNVFVDSNISRAMNQKEICGKVNKEIQKSLQEQPLPAGVERILPAISPNSSLKEICKKLLPEIKKNWAQKVDATTSLKLRDPPGEEITQDNLPIAKSKSLQNPIKVMPSSPRIRTDSSLRNRRSSSQ